MSISKSIPVSFQLNGVRRSVDAAPDTRLSDILRDGFDLTASKVGCGIGRCGACTVLMNGRAVNGCLVMAWQIEGAEIISPEGLDIIPFAQILKDSLSEENAFQCGYCAPGFTMALTALFLDNPNATQPDILAALEGNICRCTGYHSIMRGAQRAAHRLRAAKAVADLGDHLP
ncbi:(2Fe-2S)-binding protein [Rhizobium sp. 18055]|uniref:(2Fe-2S)-binding protein n=1 Tax=Rhizobium sp. 18055 TaxID=2681403 RepID=UPI00135B64BB|nr:(2Fe-2S)-binding protein [Rhizobium sp. 18055]